MISSPDHDLAERRSASGFLLTKLKQGAILYHLFLYSLKHFCAVCFIWKLVEVSQLESFTDASTQDYSFAEIVPSSCHLVEFMKQQQQQNNPQTFNDVLRTTTLV